MTEFKMFHLYPVNDEQEHVTEGTGCPCGPVVEWDTGRVIHHSWDRREIIEEAQRLAADDRQG